MLFELQVARTEGKRSLVLRRELASFVVPVGGDVAESKPELVEHVTEATQGPPQVDVAEARRAFEIGRQAANARLVALKDEVRAEYPGDEAIAPVSSLGARSRLGTRSVSANREFARCGRRQVADGHECSFESPRIHGFFLSLTQLKRTGRYLVQP